jgi:hypothetical protein
MRRRDLPENTVASHIQFHIKERALGANDGPTRTAEASVVYLGADSGRRFAEATAEIPYVDPCPSTRLPFVGRTSIPGSADRHWLKLGLLSLDKKLTFFVDDRVALSVKMGGAPQFFNAGVLDRGAASLQPHAGYCGFDYLHRYEP